MEANRYIPGLFGMGVWSEWDFCILGGVLPYLGLVGRARLLTTRVRGVNPVFGTHDINVNGGMDSKNYFYCPECDVLQLQLGTSSL